MKTLFVDEEGKLYKLDENLIITYSKRRAEKDRADRERLIEKAKKLVEEPGYYGIQTSEKNMKPEDILEAYHTLWKIEESFRIMKSTLEVRPIFHWTEGRIKGHFIVCFLAFLLQRKLEYELNKAGIINASPEKIREAINKLEFAEIELNGTKYYIKTKGTEFSNKIQGYAHSTAEDCSCRRRI